MRGVNSSSTVLVAVAGVFILFFAVLLVPLMVVSGVGGAAPMGSLENCEAEQPKANKNAKKIPPAYLALYKKAGAEYGISWTVLAGVGQVETSHGQSKLPGATSGENYAGAGGPMQFLEPTWKAYGVDGNEDGKKDRYDPADAIPGAANYLKASGAPKQLRKAIFAYNHSNEYVDLVLSWAEKYGSVAEARETGTPSCTSEADEGSETSSAPSNFKRRSPRTGATGCAAVTQLMIGELDTVLGRYTVIGCARPGDPQDHGTGHAADFMLSAGGRMPFPEGQALGKRTADYLISNYRRLRVKYVIWQQRIWNPSICKCWRQMEDRGSITQNHFDHVHASVLSK